MLYKYDKKRLEQEIYSMNLSKYVKVTNYDQKYKCLEVLLYNIETKVFMQSVKRNIKRFPESFMFQLTKEEFENLRSQFVTSKGAGGRRYNPYVFTEQGIAMLSGVLKSDIAINTSIMIMNSFVSMRHYLNTNLIEQKYINKLVLEDHEKLDLIFSKFDKDDEYLYLPGQIYDAYSKILDIFKKAKKELIIIDSYADKNLLDIIKTLRIKVIIITKTNNLLTKLDIEKYNKQYSNLKVIYNDTFHDRYFILDKNIVYHCGASINGIGKKTFSITLLGDKDINKLFIDKVNNLF